jgi:hypothetical protein
MAMSVIAKRESFGRSPFAISEPRDLSDFVARSKVNMVPPDLPPPRSTSPLSKIVSAGPRVLPDPQLLPK